MYFFFENPGFWVKVELFWVVDRFKGEHGREHAIPWLYEGGDHIIFLVLDTPLRWWGDKDASRSAPTHAQHPEEEKERQDGS